MAIPVVDAHTSSATMCSDNVGPVETTWEDLSASSVRGEGVECVECWFGMANVLGKFLEDKFARSSHDA